MRLSVQEIARFPKCPRYYHLLNKYPIPEDPNLDIIRKVISRCYVKRTEYFKRAEWRVVMSWVDRFIFRDVDFVDREEFSMARANAERVIRFLFNWYNDYYKKDTREAFSNVPLERMVGSCCVYSSPLSIVVDNVPELWILDSRDISSVFNDLEMRLTAWLFLDNLNTDAVLLRYMQLGSKYGSSIKQQKFTRKQVSNMNQYARHICQCICSNIDYTSLSESCYTCEVRDRCIV